MKTLGTFLFILISTFNFAQDLQIVKQETNEVVHIFKPGERLFITKENVYAVQPAVFYRVTSDSIFFKHDSFLITDLKKVAKASNGNYISYFVFSAYEIFGTGSQVIGLGFMYLPGFANQYDTENVAFSLLVGGAFYLNGVIAKNIARILKTFAIGLTDFSKSDFDFVASST